MADNKQNTNPNVPNLSFKREQSESCFDSAERVINQKQNVPNLRFPEFTEDWVTIRLGDSCDINMCKRIFANQTSEVGDIPIYKIGTIGNIPDSYISKELFEEYKQKYNYPRKGEVLITCAGTVGKAIVFNGEDSYYQDSNIVWIDNPTNELDNTFLYYKINCVDWSKLNSTTITRIYNDDLRKLKISYPSIAEQIKISKLLQVLDQRIATQNKIIEDLKKLKVAISQVCFEQKPIDEIPLHKFFKKGKAGGTPTSTNKEYYDGEIPFLSINDITEQGKYIYSTEKHLSEKGLLNSSAWVVPVNSLILSMYASVGLTTINKIPLATSQAMFSMELKEPELIDYLYYYLTYFKYRYIHRYLETGTQSNINADIVRSIKIPNYGKSKNIEMSAMLANIDKKIEIENIYIQSLLSQKAYLLSNMFI